PFGAGGEAGADRVQDDVPGELQRVPVTLDENRVEAALEEMAGHRVAVVEPLGILAVQLLESRREVARRLEHKVVVVWHQAVGVAAPPPASHDEGEELGEAGAIALVLVDRLASVATRGHVVDGAGDADP